MFPSLFRTCIYVICIKFNTKYRITYNTEASYYSYINFIIMLKTWHLFIFPTQFTHLFQITQTQSEQSPVEINSGSGSGSRSLTTYRISTPLSLAIWLRKLQTRIICWQIDALLIRVYIFSANWNVDFMSHEIRTNQSPICVTEIKVANKDSEYEIMNCE